MIAVCVACMSLHFACWAGARDSQGSASSVQPSPTIQLANASGVELSVDSARTAFANGGEVRFWLTLRNRQGPDCVPFFVDSQPSTEVAEDPLVPRPHTAITLRIRDEHGREVKPRWPGGIRAAALRAHQLTPLYCGHGYAWEVWPAHVPWGYELAAGRYTVAVSVRVPVGSFFRMHDGLEAKVMELWEPAGDAAKAYLRDIEAPSVEVSFVVARE